VRILLTQLLNGTDAALLRGIGDLLRHEAKRANGDKNIFLDFEGIVSISRAFAHELFLFQVEQESKGYQVHIEHFTDELVSIFEIVQRTAKTPREPLSAEWVQSEFEQVANEFDSWV
jgi:hypothetical protein